MINDESINIKNKVMSAGAFYAEFIVENPNIDSDFRFATLLVNLLTSYKLNYGEVRVSCSKFKIRIDEKEVKTKNIREYL